MLKFPADIIGVFDKNGPGRLVNFFCALDDASGQGSTFLQHKPVALEQRRCR